MYMLSLLVFGPLLLVALAGLPVLSGHRVRRWWTVPLVSGGAFAACWLFLELFMGRPALAMCGVEAAFAAAGCALARRPGRGWLGGGALTVLGALLFAASFAVTWLVSFRSLS